MPIRKATGVANPLPSSGILYPLPYFHTLEGPCPMCEGLDLSTVNPSLARIEWALSKLFGHKFEFTEAEGWNILHHLHNRLAGFRDVDGAILTWNRVHGDIVVHITT